MHHISNIGTALKKIYRLYSNQIIIRLEQRGFTDLRPSFLEVLKFVCEKEGTTIKEIGIGCGLKKQTMTGHLNELSKRGYIVRKINKEDKREQNVYLTEYGEKFKVNLFESINELENLYTDIFGKVELKRVELQLTNFHSKIALTQKSDQNQR